MHRKPDLVIITPVATAERSPIFRLLPQNYQETPALARFALRHLHEMLK